MGPWGLRAAVCQPKSVLPPESRAPGSTCVGRVASVISKEEMLPLDSRSLSGTATDTPGKKLEKEAATLLPSPSLKCWVISAPNASHSNQTTHRPGQHLWMMIRAPKGDQNTESKV